MPPVLEHDQVPQLIINGEEIRCPRVETHGNLKTYLKLRSRKSGETVLSINWYPDKQYALSKILLVEVTTIAKDPTIAEMYVKLIPILENGIVRMASAVDSLKGQSETLGKDVTATLSVWNNVLAVVEVVSTLEGNLSPMLESLLGSTTVGLEDLSEAAEIEDTQAGIAGFKQLIEIAQDWLEVLEE